MGQILYHGLTDGRVVEELVDEQGEGSQTGALQK